MIISVKYNEHNGRIVEVFDPEVITGDFIICRVLSETGLYNMDGLDKEISSVMHKYLRSQKLKEIIEWK